LAGRVGSAITAELASMTVHQDIDALTMMNIPAEKVLVLPRLAAVLVMMPVLIIFAKIVVWSGGSMVAKHVNYLGISPESYFAALRHYTKFKDVISGMAKAEAFGFVVVLVCCAIGLNTRGGTPK
jgi:phospholipid/cholesterol/gamma-HCH transport system permease protein